MVRSCGICHRCRRYRFLSCLHPYRSCRPSVLASPSTWTTVPHTADLNVPKRIFGFLFEAITRLNAVTIHGTILCTHMRICNERELTYSIPMHQSCNCCSTICFTLRTNTFARADLQEDVYLEFPKCLDPSLAVTVF